MKLQLKRSNVLEGGAAKEPTAPQVEYGELCVNYNKDDPALFIKDSDDIIIRIAGAGSVGSGETPSGDTNPPTGNKPGDVFFNTLNATLYYWNGSEWVPIASQENAADIFVGTYAEVNVAIPVDDRKNGLLLWETTEGILYIWYIDADTKQWVEASPGGGGGGGASVSVLPTAPTGASQGDLWYCTLDGRLYVYYEDAATSQWVDASPDNAASPINSGENWPATANENDLFFRTSDGRLYIYYNDGDSLQWVDASPDSPSEIFWKREGTTISPITDGDDVVTSGDLSANNGSFDGDLTVAGDIQSTSQNGGQLAGFRNQIINGSMVVAQRTTGNNDADTDDFTVDRWRAWVSGSLANSFGWGRAICSIPEATALGFYYALEIRNPVDPQWNIKQGIELYETGQYPFTQGSTWTFSCYASEEVSAYLAKASGTAVGSSGNACTRTSSNYNSSTGRYVATFTIDAADPADLQCMSISISNATGTINAATQIVACQLEPGSVPTPFEHRPYATELALCERYYQQHVSAPDNYSYGFGGVGGTANLEIYCGIQFPTTMRTSPTVTSTAPSSFGCNGWWLAAQTSVKGFTFYTKNNGTGQWYLYMDYTADAEL